MAQHGDAGVDANLFVDAFGDIHGAAGALGHHDHVVGAAGQAGPADLFHDVLVKIQGTLRDQHSGGAYRDAHVQG